MMRIPGEKLKTLFSKGKEESRLMTQLAPHFHSFVKIQDTTRKEEREERRVM
jgi:hypothetical protein